MQIINEYNFDDAISDGTFVDVSALAKEAGFVYPVAVTRGVWSDYVKLPESYVGCQDQTGRLWDVLFMSAYAIKRNVARGEKARAVRVELRVRGVEPRRDTVGRGGRVGTRGRPKTARTRYAAKSSETVYQDKRKISKVTLFAGCGPRSSANPEPVIIIMKPNEL